MKSTVIYKALDLIFQLFFFYLSYDALRGHPFGLDAMVDNAEAYFYVGGAQVFSCIINRITLGDNRTKSRKAYEYTLLIVLIFSVVSIVVIPLFVYWGLFLLAFSPLMALSMPTHPTPISVRS